VVQRVADCFGGRTASGQFRDLRFEPDAQFRNQRFALGLTHRQPIGGGLAADTRLDLIERGNALQRFRRDGCLRLGQIVKAPAYVAPAKSQRYGSLGRF
jgi:hypothetical protein